MEQKALAPAEEVHQVQKEENLFSDLADIRPYERTMKNGRGWLYAIVVIQFLLGIFHYFTIEDNYLSAVTFGIEAFIGLVFLALIFWSKKKPFAAFTTALSIYILISLTFMMLDPASITKGVILKILVIVALGKAIRDAKEYERVKEAVGQ